MKHLKVYQATQLDLDLTIANHMVYSHDLELVYSGARACRKVRNLIMANLQARGMNPKRIRSITHFIIKITLPEVYNV